MAYLSFSPWTSHTVVSATRAATAAEASRFTAVELRVIQVAERVDVSREIPHHSRKGRFLERVLGVKLGRPLASPRLEALRRFASLLCHHPETLSGEDVEELVAAGFTPGQASGLIAYFTSPRARLHHHGIT